MSLTNEEIADKVFDLFDKDNNGDVDLVEFHKACMRLEIRGRPGLIDGFHRSLCPEGELFFERDDLLEFLEREHKDRLLGGFVNQLKKSLGALDGLECALSPIKPNPTAVRAQPVKDAAHSQRFASPGGGPLRRRPCTRPVGGLGGQKYLHQSDSTDEFDFAELELLEDLEKEAGGGAYTDEIPAYDGTATKDEAADRGEEDEANTSIDSVEAMEKALSGVNGLRIADIVKPKKPSSRRLGRSKSSVNMRREVSSTSTKSSSSSAEPDWRDAVILQLQSEVLQKQRELESSKEVAMHLIQQLEKAHRPPTAAVPVRIQQKPVESRTTSGSKWSLFGKLAASKEKADRKPVHFTDVVAAAVSSIGVGARAPPKRRQQGPCVPHSAVQANVWSQKDPAATPVLGIFQSRRVKSPSPEEKSMAAQALEAAMSAPMAINRGILDILDPLTNKQSDRVQGRLN